MPNMAREEMRSAANSRGSSAEAPPITKCAAAHYCAPASPVSLSVLLAAAALALPFLCARSLMSGPRRRRIRVRCLLVVVVVSLSEQVTFGGRRFNERGGAV